MFRPLFILFISLFISLVLAEVSAESAERRIEEIDTPLTDGEAEQAEVDTAVAIVNATNCNPNICFAIDGSGSMDETEFTLEKDFVKLVAAVVALDPQSKYAAVQYGLRPAFVSTLTEDADAFLLNVDAAQSLDAPRTFIAPGLGACMRQLRRVQGQPQKIILLGDGRSNFDALAPPLDPPSIAQSFLASPNASISAIGVGNFQDPDMLEGIAGSPDRVFKVAQWLDVIFVLADLVADVCGLENVEF
ncbi:von Willebrand factor type A [Gracilaria domingensis]|nr:von Willebrand factor type A [Gracilaria domingensis]